MNYHKSDSTRAIARRGLFPLLAAIGSCFFAAHLPAGAESVDFLDHLPPAGSEDGDIQLGVPGGTVFDTAAQAFETGWQGAGGYLSTITVRLENDNGGGASTARVKLWSGTDDSPTAEIEDLGTVGLIGIVEDNFTVLSSTKPYLLPDTRYWVSVTSESGEFRWKNNQNTIPTGSGTMALPSVRSTSVDGTVSWNPLAPGASNYRQFMAVTGTVSPVVVLNTNDSGPDSLRDAIANAPAGRTIRFDPSLSGKTLTLTSGQLTIDRDLIIDASTLAGGLTINADQKSRVLEITPGHTVVLHSLALTGGKAAGSAPANYGGAIYNDHSTLSLSACTLSGNSADFFGGGIYSDGQSGGATLSLSACTLSENSASKGGGIYSNGQTGSATVSLSNCTLAGNSAASVGGGLFNDGVSGSVAVSLSACTFSENSATYNGGGIFNDGTTGSVTLSLASSIIAGNTAAIGPDIHNFSGTVTPTAPNLIGDGSDSGIGVIPGLIGTAAAPIAPKLAPLSDYGGPTRTMHPVVGSPAIDPTGGATSAAGTDQRGFPRLNGATIDIGAVEVENLAPEIVVEQPAGTGLTDGTGSIAFGDIEVGASLASTVTISNAGTDNLTGLAVTKTGSHAADFTLGAPGATSLAPGESTTFSVTFLTSASGPRTAAIHIASNDADENPFDIALTGTGVAPPAPEIVVEQPAGTGLTDGSADIAFGSVDTGASAARTFTIKNTGTADLTGLAVTKNGTHNADFTLGDLGASTLAAGASTTFEITFSPGAAGARTAAIFIASNDADENPFDIALTGTGVASSAAPEIVVQQGKGEEKNLEDGQSTRDLGAVTVGKTGKLMTFTVMNVGTAKLKGLKVLVEGKHAKEFKLGAPGATGLAAGSSTTFTVGFSPAADGPRTAKLKIESNDADENPFNIALTGTGNPLPAPEIVVQQGKGTAKDLEDGKAKRNLGSVPVGKTGKPMTFRVKNEGTAKLKGLKVVVQGKHAKDFKLGALKATSLSPGASTTFTVSFNPGAIGARAGKLVVESNDADENPFNIALSGAGTKPPAPEIAVKQGEGPGSDLKDGTSKRDLGSVKVGKTGKPMTFTVKNAGTADLKGLKVVVQGKHTKDFKAGALGATNLAPGASTTFTVEFSPRATGARSGALRIASNDANENPFNITLAGKGTDPPPPTAPEIAVKQGEGATSNLQDGRSTRDLGVVKVGQTGEPMTFKVKNSGTATLKGLKLVVQGQHATDFKAGALGKTNLAPGASTTFTVEFSPGATGARSGALQISSNDANENPFDIALAGTGKSSPAPGIVVQQGKGPRKNLKDGRSMRNLGTVTVGKSGKVMTFRVKNVGKRNLKNLKLLVRGKHAEDFQVVKTLTRKTLKPGVILTFKIAFKPTEDGLRKADLRIKSNDADENPFNVKLSGTGRLPASEE